MDFTQARYNMVEQQIRPWDVLDFDLLDALGEVPRERFVLPEQQGVAYTDEVLKLANGGSMLEPRLVARLIQALALTRADTVLEIGTGSGYAAAVMAKLAAKVVSTDTDAQQSAFAQAAVSGLGMDNIEFQVADGLDGQSAGNTRFNAVYVGGSVPVLPPALKNLLADGGRLVAIVGQGHLMHAIRVVRHGDEYRETVLFETSAPALSSPALRAPSAFSF